MSFKVAILGNPSQSVDDLFGSYFTYGIQVYDLAAEQICSILQSPDHSNGIDVAKLGTVPVNKYELNGGGRFFPLVTREEIAQVMQGVDVMLIMSSTHAFSLDYMTLEFYEALIGDNLLDKCKAVVLKVFSGKADPIFGRNSKPLTVEDILTKSGLSKASTLQTKLYIVADKEVKLGKRRSKGKKSKKGVEAVDVVSQLRAHLLGEEVKVAITAPVKETLTAGKALLNMGQRFSSWVASLVKSS